MSPLILGLTYSRKKELELQALIRQRRGRGSGRKGVRIHATNWAKEKLDGAITGDDDLIIRTEAVGGMGKYGRLLGWLTSETLNCLSMSR